MLISPTIPSQLSAVPEGVTRSGVMFTCLLRNEVHPKLHQLRLSSILEPNLSVTNSPTSERIIRGGTHPQFTKLHSRYDIVVMLLV